MTQHRESTKVPRRTRLRRLVLRHRFTSFVVTLLLVTLAVRLVWGWHLSRQVAKRVAEIRAAGHPATLADVVLEPVPDAENAWLVFVRAIGALKPGVDSPRNSVLEYPWYPPYGDAWEQLAAASEAAHGKAFALARNARGSRRAQPRPSVSDPVTIFFDVAYNDGRTLANVLTDGASFAHLRGDHAEAIERLHDVLHMGRSLRADPFLISQLVGIGYDALATSAAQTIAPTLAVDRPPEAGGRAASRQQVLELIAELLDERDAHAVLARTFASERAQVHDLAAGSTEGMWAISPLSDHVKLRWFDAFDTLIEAARQPNMAAANRLTAPLGAKWDARPSVILPGERSSKTRVPRYSRWFDSSEGPASIASVIRQYYRQSADRRVTAISLAARLYRLDHDGRWPDSLADLVPNYVPQVPADPFSEDGRPFAYVIQRGALPDGGDRPLVYFDAGGSDGVIDTEPMFGWQNEPQVNRKAPTRQYRDLALWLPTPRRFEEERRLAAEAVEDDPEEPDAPGNHEQNHAKSDEPARE